MLLLKKKKYAAVTLEKNRDGSIIQKTELKGIFVHFIKPYGLNSHLVTLVKSLRTPQSTYPSYMC